MEASFAQENINDKKEKYLHFIEQYAPLIDGERNIISVLANTTAALKEAFGFFWTGFYLVSVACYRIKRGRGVCGTAWAEAQTQVVADVDKFPGHIACSSLSRSEIVVPMISGGEVVGVLDIDSDNLNTFDETVNTFDETDRIYLEKIVEMIVKNLY